MRVSLKTILLILAHVFVFNFLFVFRYPIQEAFAHQKEWKYGHGTFRGNALAYLKLYYSNITDEAYYYEWSTIVLGKSFEKAYPFEKRDKSPFYEHFFKPPSPHLPYRDIEFEYPPLMLLPLLLPRLVSHDYLGYIRLLSVFLSLIYLTCLAIFYQLWKKIPEAERFAWHRILFLSLLSILCLGQIFVTRLDVFPNLFSLLALLFFLNKKYTSCAFWIVLGTLTKGYAILLAPLFGIVLLLQKKYKDLSVSISWILLLLTGVSLALGYYTEGHYWDSFRFHANRGIQIESIYAMIPYSLYLFCKTHIFVYNSHNAVDITMSGIHYLLSCAKLLPPLLFLALYFIFWKKSKTLKEIHPLWLIQSSFLVIFSFMISFKVLSPQFLIWLIPLIFLISPAHKKEFYFLFLALLLLTQIIYPNFYWMLSDETHPEGVALLLTRNIALLILYGWAVKDWIARPLSSPSHADF